MSARSRQIHGAGQQRFDHKVGRHVGDVNLYILAREESLVPGDHLINFQGCGVGRAHRQPIGCTRSGAKRERRYNENP
jgi:hypothetical protein